MLIFSGCFYYFICRSSLKAVILLYWTESFSKIAYLPSQGIRIANILLSPESTCENILSMLLYLLLVWLLQSNLVYLETVLPELTQYCNLLEINMYLYPHLGLSFCLYSSFFPKIWIFGRNIGGNYSQNSKNMQNRYVKFDFWLKYVKQSVWEMNLNSILKM